jgi:hypothetical protein
MTIKPGDVVMVRGSRQPLNVRSVSADYQLCLCTWMDEEGNRHSDTFPLEDVELFWSSGPDDETRW